jgi:hypothetical protein
MQEFRRPRRFLVGLGHQMPIDLFSQDASVVPGPGFAAARPHTARSCRNDLRFLHEQQRSPFQVVT